MSRLSGLNPALLAARPVPYGRSLSAGEWLRATWSSVRYTVPLMLTIYGLQTVLKLARSRRGATPAGEGGGGAPAASAARAEPPLTELLRRMLVNTGRTSALYTFLAVFTNLVLVKGLLPNAATSGFWRWRNLRGHLVMSMFAVFGVEPISRGSVLAEYYLAHWAFGWLSSLKYATGGATAGIGRVLVPLAVFYGCLTPRHASFRKALEGGEKAMASAGLLPAHSTQAG